MAYNILLVVMIGGFVLTCIIAPVIGYTYEKKVWNNGTCPVCGAEWRCIDTDSQGGRMYVCNNGCTHCEISYNSIDRC